MDEQQRRAAARIINETYCDLIYKLVESQASTDQVRDEIATLNDEWSDVFAGARASAADRVARRWAGAR